MTSTWLPLFDTRQAAHAQVQPTKQDTYARILAYAEQRGLHGFTADQCASDFGCVHNHVSPRIGELVRAGELIITGRRRPTRSGCLARIFVAKKFPQRRADPSALTGSLFGDLAPESWYPD